MPRKDYYATLGVGREAGTEEIKRAFRRLARETHPDANPGDAGAEARFREVAEAYEVLSNADSRRRYDRGDTIDLTDLFTGFGSFDDLLRSVFGDSGLFGRTQTRRGRDLLVPVRVSLAEAAFGTESEVTIRGRVSCPVCGGDGAAPGTGLATCPTCRGSGAVRVARRGLLGTVMTVASCETCGGTGQTVSVPCARCAGSGVIDEERTVRVEVPAGVADGTRLRLTGQGEAAGRLAPPGDLYVEIAVSPDPRFRREGSDLIHTVAVGIAAAALGTAVEVSLLEGGAETLEIPPGTQPGWSARMRGLGVPHLGRRGRGDLVVQVQVEVPTGLTEDEEEALRRFAELRGERAAEPAGRRRRRSR